MKCVCVERGCPESFEITESEARRFEARGFSLPRRCQKHRAARRPLRGGLYHILGGEHQRFVEGIRLYTKHNET